MGGSGSSWTIPSIERVQEKVYDAQKETMDESTKAEVNEILNEKLKEFNNRDVEQINTHINVIKQALEKDIDGSLKLLFGGSVSKHTYIDGLSDVDVLVAVNGSSLSNEKPKDALEYFHNRLKERFPKSDITMGNLAITIKFSSGNEVQLLPAIQTKSGMKISKVGMNEWSNVVKPKKFGKELTKINSQQSGNVVPVIKLCKAINDGLKKKNQLSGYHIEAVAVKAFKNYKGNKDYNTMLNHLCKSISTSVLKPMKESTGQSYYIDNDLGKSNSAHRKVISKNYERISNKIENVIQSGKAKNISDIV